MSTPLLEFKEFSKDFRSQWTFRKVQAVKNLALSVHRGEAFGFIGHNGAGKTTSIKCLMGLLRPSQGSILFDGKPLDAERRRAIGFLPELPYFYDHLTVWETMDFFASLHGLPRVEKARQIWESLEKLQIADRAHTRVRSLSKGLQQRLGFAQAIVNQPELLVLDEPFSGLDPLGRRDLRQLILDLHRHGTTIFMSSHILSDVEDICHRVAIMARGDLKTVISLTDNDEMEGTVYELVLMTNRDNCEATMTNLSAIVDEMKLDETSGGTRVCAVTSSREAGEAALRWALAHGVAVNHYERRRPALEDIFIKVTTERAPAPSLSDALREDETSTAETRPHA